jgi:precorrin-2/cobalt-factor-2 C20-methyltransferase
MKRLIGVGVGPGDPELVTVKAVRVLREADVVLVPVLAGADPADPQAPGSQEPGRAETIIRGYVEADKISRAERHRRRHAAARGRVADVGRRRGRGVRRGRRHGRVRDPG